MRLYDLRPGIDFGLEETCVVFRIQVLRFEAARGQAAFEFPTIDRSSDSGLKPGDHICRRFRGRENSIGEPDIEAGEALVCDRLDISNKRDCLDEFRDARRVMKVPISRRSWLLVLTYSSHFSNG